MVSRNTIDNYENIIKAFDIDISTEDLKNKEDKKIYELFTKYFQSVQDILTELKEKLEVEYDDIKKSVSSAAKDGVDSKTREQLKSKILTALEKVEQNLKEQLQNKTTNSRAENLITNTLYSPKYSSVSNLHDFVETNLVSIFVKFRHLMTINDSSMRRIVMQVSELLTKLLLQIQADIYRIQIYRQKVETANPLSADDFKGILEQLNSGNEIDEIKAKNFRKDKLASKVVKQLKTRKQNQQQKEAEQKKPPKKKDGFFGFFNQEKQNPEEKTEKKKPRKKKPRLSTFFEKKKKNQQETLNQQETPKKPKKPKEPKKSGISKRRQKGEQEEALKKIGKLQQGRSITEKIKQRSGYVRAEDSLDLQTIARNLVKYYH